MKKGCNLKYTGIQNRLRHNQKVADIYQFMIKKKIVYILSVFVLYPQSENQILKDIFEIPKKSNNSIKNQTRKANKICQYCVAIF